ncbi:hypothetical protein [Methylovulum miyakonense]|uniref:hypothetical protein n=1 Tax=Methylovulum miyakonense TaxID=645578 RepID=UPI0003680CAD|nr:hypothetical protein [Methylovulum miyakonense]
MAFEDTAVGVPPMELAEFLIKRRSYLPKEVRQYLQDNFSAPSDSQIGNGSDFDLHEEIMSQIKAAKALRSQAIPDNGAQIPDIREAKEALTASTSLIKTLQTTLEKIYNQDRVRTLQQVLVETLKEVDPAIQARFLSLLKERFK